MRIFLSHSTKDGGFVQRLATALDANGFTPRLCEVDIEKGANFVAKINEGLAQSDLALLIWSQHAANSAWTLEEWTAALARQVEENRIRLGIVLLRDCPMPLPPLLRTKNYVDARADEDAGIDGVLGWLKKRHQAQRLSGLRAPVYLPDYRPQDFVGRSAYLARLQETLTAEPGVFLLYGEPGAGKTMLALRFAWDAQKDFDAVIFQTCGQRPLDAITAELVERLPIEVKTLAPDKQREESIKWLKARQSLFVLDDVWLNGQGKFDVKQLEPGPPCSVLYTSRERTLPGISSRQSEEVEKFTGAEAEELFHTYLDPVFGEDAVTQSRAALLDFAKRVEMLPIAVAVGASMLREKSATALTRAVLKLRLENLADGATDVNALFRTAIASQPERERKLLAAGAVCVQEGFWLPLAAEIVELSEDEAEEQADHLVHSSLLRVTDRERRRFQLHALLREQVRAQQRDDGLGKLQERHAAALERLFKDWGARWQECRECLEEIIPATRFLYGQGGRIRRRKLIASGFWLGVRVGELDSTFRIMKGEEALWAGHDDPEARGGLMRSFSGQAVIFRCWGRLEEALALLKKAEAIALEMGDKGQLERNYTDQAGILRDWGRLEDALVLYKKQEAICLELDDKNELSKSYWGQGVILKDWGRLEEAMELLRKQQGICLELDNKDGLQYSYLNQAEILRDWGQLEESLILVQKCKAVCLELGDKRGLGYCCWNWGLLARAQGDRKTEKEKLEQALAIFTELKLPHERDEVQAELDKLGGSN